VRLIFEMLVALDECSLRVQQREKASNFSFWQSCVAPLMIGEKKVAKMERWQL
jgi:hypothetical protein